MRNGWKSLTEDIVEEVSENDNRRPHVPLKIMARDEQVLKLVLEGYDDRAVGKALGISPGTVEQHMQSRQRRIRTEVPFDSFDFS